MTERRFVKKKIYRVRQKLGGLEVVLRYPLSETMALETPDLLSFRLTGKVNEGIKTVRVDMPVVDFVKLLQLGETLDEEHIPEPGRIFCWNGGDSLENIWWLELYVRAAEEPLLKPWEFCMRAAKGNRELYLLEPIYVRISTGTLKKLLAAVKAEVAQCANFAVEGNLVE